MAAMAAGRDACGPLLTWLQTFAPPSPCASPRDLANGVALAHVLHSIDASWFNETWLGRIRDDAEDNWRLKVSNLRKVLQSVLEYWQDVLGQAVAEQHVPDVALAAQHADPEQLGKLVRLVLGCAVSCERREEHIQRIMTLEESVQHVVMTAIQELLVKDPLETTAAETYGNFDAQSRRYYFLSEEPEEAGGPQQRCLELEQQVAVLLEEKGSLAEENRALREEKAQLEADADAAAAKKLLLLQMQVEQLQEENYRLESGKEELRARCSRLEREARGLQARAQELSGLAGEARALRDEMDVLRASSARAGRLEAAVAAYRGRAAAAGELRRWVRALEERHAAQLRRAAALQQQLGRAQASGKQLEAARRQVEELSGQQAEAALRAERWQLEFRTLQEKFEALNKEKERLLEERDALREANEELRCAQVQQSCLRQADAVLEEGTAPAGNLAAEILPAELRETVARLQQENRRLQEQEATLRLQRDQLQQRLCDADRQRLEAPGAAELQRVLGDQGDAPEFLLLKETLDELKDLPEAGAELQGDEELEPRGDVSGPLRVEELQRSLRRREEALRVLEQRCRRQAGGAHVVMRALEPKPPGPAAAPVLRALRNQLQEKDALIQHLESDYERSRAQREREERLLVTAWYNMGLAFQQQANEGQGPRGPPGGAQSFLAQQRLATAARRARPPPWPPPQPLTRGLGGPPTAPPTPNSLGWSHFKHYWLGIAPQSWGDPDPAPLFQGLLALLFLYPFSVGQGGSCPPPPPPHPFNKATGLRAGGLFLAGILRGLVEG
ncbi:protein Hook homolog 2 [Tyto alba]|uniref:protein Hook homolog 2 n=1 Tax=Tyto alba TaxID=56313 RepID=UPI001C664A30|nr:protein Hook homolog 2 [Tyto alba]